MLCPGEGRTPGNYSTSDYNEFQYSHYASNAYVMGNIGMSKNGTRGRGYMFKTGQFEDPSAIHTVGDNAHPSGFSFSYVAMLSFRHGAGDSRKKADTTPLPKGGLSNMLFLDGHAETLTLDTLLNGDGFGSPGYTCRPGTKTKYYSHPTIKGVAPVPVDQ